MLYLPPYFKDDSPNFAASEKLIRENSFATLVTVGGAEATPNSSLQISHLPLLLRKSTSGHGILVGHVARANPHWKSLATGTSTVIFQGPHTYITPSWYVSPENVPTWNYAVVHVTVQAALVEDDKTLREDLIELVAEHEKFSPKPWNIDAVPREYFDKLSHGIVGFHLTIQEITGKFKLSQNRSPEDRDGVLQGLAARTDEMSARVLGMMKKN
jgi:transcriptional regulator